MAPPSELEMADFPPGTPWELVRRNVASAQPAPTGNGTPILPLVIQDLTERQEHGRRKYGTVLRAKNGRDSLRDALEETYDLAMYLRQKVQEDSEVAAQARAAALQEVLQLVEVQLLTEDPSDAEDELGRAARLINGALRRLHAAVRGLQGQPPAEPVAAFRPGARRKQHHWEVIDACSPVRQTVAWRCRDCPLEKHFEKGPQGGRFVVVRIGDQVLASGPDPRIPPCAGQRRST